MASRFVFPVHFEVENAVGVDYESALALTPCIFLLHIIFLALKMSHLSNLGTCLTWAL